jgi:ribosomal protein S12 methylthiotransferase
MEEIRFERLGVIAYSREPGTPAHDLPNQIGEKVKERRKEKVMKLQAKISAAWAEAQVGTERTCLIEGRVPDSDWYVGRSDSEAADIDGVVRIHSVRELATGDFVRVRVVEADVYDLTAEAIDA